VETNQVEKAEFKIMSIAHVKEAPLMEAYISLFVKAVFIENLALSFFLGMCIL